MVKIVSIPLCAMALAAFVMFSQGRCEEGGNRAGPLGLALHLIDRKEYDLALLEIERLIYLNPNSPEIPRARLLSGYCHMEAGRFAKALAILEEIVASFPMLSDRALFLTAECLFRQGKLRDAEYYFKVLAEKEADPEIRLAALYRLGWTRMKGDDWKEASRIFLSMDGEDALSSEARAMAPKVLKGDGLPLKDPQVAGLLAGLMPGMGHAYVGRYRDAATAFILNAAFILAAGEAFREDHLVLGGILTFLEIGWYAGNIYSAVNAAHKHNRRLCDDFRDGFMDRLKLTPLLSQGGLAGIGLSLRY